MKLITILQTKQGITVRQMPDEASEFISRNYSFLKINDTILYNNREYKVVNLTAYIKTNSLIVQIVEK